MNLTQVLAILKAISDELNVEAAEETIRAALMVPHTYATVVNAIDANSIAIFPDATTRPVIVATLNGSVALWDFIHPAAPTLAAVFPAKSADLA